MPGIAINETAPGRLIAYFTAVSDGTSAALGTPLQSSDMGSFTINYTYNGSAVSTYTITATQVDSTNRKGLFYLNLPADLVASANGAAHGDKVCVVVVNASGTQHMVRREVEIELDGRLDVAVSTVPAILLATPVDGALTFKSVINIIASSTAAKVRGWLAGIHKYRNLSDTQDVIIGTVTTDGRTSVALTPP